MYIRIKCSYTPNTHAHLNEHTHTHAQTIQKPQEGKSGVREREREG